MTAVTGPPRCTSRPRGEQPHQFWGEQRGRSAPACTSRPRPRPRHRGHRGDGGDRRQRPRRRGGRGGQRSEEWRRHQVRARGRDHRLLPEPGPAGHLGHPGRRGDLRHAHRAQQQGRRRAVPRQVGHAERELHPVDDRAAAQHQVPGRRGARRERGEAEPRHLRVPARRRRRRGRAAVHDLPRVHPERERRRPAHRAGQPQDAGPGVRRVPVLDRPLWDHGAGADQRELLDRHDRHRALQAPVVQPERVDRRDEEPELLAARVPEGELDHLRPDPGRSGPQHPAAGRLDRHHPPVQRARVRRPAEPERDPHDRPGPRPRARSSICGCSRTSRRSTSRSPAPR